ncbi:MAG: hypothetical protein P1U81_16045 [Verrucomicrobiales bacterium]|jgi:hypothetical protein|nr:hypothetical protein [Verrucomicrobiales bacterium]
MKKNILIVLTVTFLLAGGVQARTWTSSDGAKTFEGTLRSYNAETGQVTVVVNGRPLSFEKDKLSADDIKFLEEEAATPVDLAEEASKTVVGAQMVKAKLNRLDGERYKKAELAKAPEYYILYYSASW